MEKQQWKMMKNRDKTMKNDATEKKNTQWNMMKNRETQMKNYEKERKNNETWWKREDKTMNNDEK